MDGKRYRIQGANTLSLPAEDAEKLLALGDGECALLYLYILRSGGVLDTAAAARAMSYLKTQVMLSMKPGDATTADLISTGCSMGIKSLARYCNQYPTADEDARGLAQSLIRLEDQLVKDMRPYL